jgi:glucans biosynthesis protein
VNRRQFLATSVAVPVIVSFSSAIGAQAPNNAAAKPQDTPFDPVNVRQMARELAQKAYQAPDMSLPDGLKKLDYDKYRKIRFVPEKALWRGENLPFQIQFFHRGFFFSNRVDIYEVSDGRARPIRYSPGLFTFEDVAAPPPDADLGFGGFRIHAPMNRPDYYDEVGVFLGASYFRAVAKGQNYGLSARGLAINTAEPKGEEFPFFKIFWIEKPQPKTNSIVVHALLDSKSAAAAYRMTIRPGETTVYDVEMNLYPRTDIPEVGIAPMTSMFFSTPMTGRTSMIFVPPCTTRMGWRCATAAAKCCGARSATRPICRSRVSTTSIRAVSGCCSVSAIFTSMKTLNPTSKSVRASASNRSAIGVVAKSV